jgi:peptide/nickel transport system substrate-binding protein
MLKKLLSVLLVAVMMVSIVGCSNGNDTGVSTEEPTTVPVEETDPTTTPEAGAPAEASGQIIIGSTTELGGDFVPYFQNGAADYDVFQLISGQMTNGTSSLTTGGEFVVNTAVVEEPKVDANEDGTKTYTWTLKDGQVWNDGSAVTAADYVSTILLWSSKVVGDMGAQNNVGQYFTGYKEYAAGEAKEFTGVRLIDEKTFAVTISAENLPYFYELDLASTYPTKLSFWTDDTVTVADDGKGAYISDNFTKEAYESKINDARTAVPRTTAGAYNLTSYDESSKTAVLDVNPLFKGNFEGQTAKIQTIIYKKVTTETALDELQTGSVDILNAMASGDEINAGLDLVDAGGFSYTSYDRNGYGKLSFVCDFGPTQFVEVRQAIAHLLDRNDFAKAFTQGFGSVVNGPYGTAMWMVQESPELATELDSYAYSLDDAIKLLEEGGWVYDKDGKDYTSGVRYKKLEDGTLMPLIIEWASSEANAVSELLVVKLQENPDLAAAGIQINQTVMTFTELLNYLYRDGSIDAKYAVPTYSMYNLATGFTPVYDQAQYYTTDEKQIAAGYNNNYIVDEDLYQAAKKMVLVDPSDRDGFRTNFVSFVDRWNELLPDLPLYSNVYHDFYNAKLQNYNPNSIWDLTEALIYAYVQE